jgi:tol-pal system protein YbgF
MATQQDTNTLKLQLQAINNTLSQVQNNQAELAARLDELSQAQAMSNENLMQLDNQISNLSAKLDDMSVSMRSRTGRTNNAAPANAMLPSDMFNEAKNLLEKGAFEEAATGFKLYISKYPNTEQTEQAYIYMGDAYTGLNQSTKAAVAYATLLQKFPKSKLTATARLKYAQSIVPLGKIKEAKMYLASIAQEFPSAPEVAQAQEVLASLP